MANETRQASSQGSKQTSNMKLKEPPDPRELLDIPANSFCDPTFRPRPGDFIIRDRQPKGEELLTLGGVVRICTPEFQELKDDNDKNVAFYHRVFRPGDHVLRVGVFDVENWHWHPADKATVYLYWPEFTDLGVWFRMSEFLIVSPLRIDVPSVRLNVLTEQEFIEGDIFFRSYPISDPNRPWNKELAWGQVSSTFPKTAIDLMKKGDRFVRITVRSVQELGGIARVINASNAHQLWSTRINAQSFLRTERWWKAVGEDCHIFTRFALPVAPVLDVPKPGDIMVSFDEEFRPFDQENGYTGGAIQIYEDPLHFDRTPDNPRPPQERVRHPYVVRIGVFEQQDHRNSGGDRKQWVFVPSPTIEVFDRKPGAAPWIWRLRARYLLNGRTLVQPRTINVDWEELPIEIGHRTSEHEFNDPTDGDIVLRSTYYSIAVEARNTGIPFVLETEYEDLQMSVTYFHRSLKVEPGDLIIRIRSQPNVTGNGHWDMTAELYERNITGSGKCVYFFRGRDKVIFGEPKDQPPEESAPAAPRNSVK